MTSPHLARIPVPLPDDTDWTSIPLHVLQAQNWEGDGDFRYGDDAESDQHDNTRRAGRALAAVAAYLARANTDNDSVLTDLICDLGHLCDALGEDFHEILTNGAALHQEEVGE